MPQGYVLPRTHPTTVHVTYLHQGNPYFTL
ncbi:hypothetical protein EV650_5936 [Kribbella kalugense]|uniref:Uncharacterized protein n=1 Tax=Kribbella kalugense TaxID=2512221 RepID=A0A4R7ZUT0_9ACTN|nr:hypothetical protein EV650_5936 [Kribbella kalugense]